MSFPNHKGRPGMIGGSLPRKNLQSLFLILKGSSTSGNYGHAGIPGKRGGSAPNKVSLPTSVLDAVRGSSNTVWIPPEETKKYMMAKGHSEDTLKEVKNLIQNGLGAGGEAQTIAEKQIVEAIKNKTPLGKAFKDHIDYETAIQKEWDAHADKRIESRIADIKENFDWYADREGGSNYDGDWYTKDQWPEVEKYARQSEERQLNLYRKGITGHRPIESWSSSEEGAKMSGVKSRGIGYDHKARFSELEKQGYKVLAGRAILAGAPGEAEVTLINMNKLR